MIDRICALFDWVIIVLKVESAEIATSGRESSCSSPLDRFVDTARRPLACLDRDSYDIWVEGSFKDVALAARQFDDFTNASLSKTHKYCSSGMST